jgi:hypothetical protein
MQGESVVSAFRATRTAHPRQPTIEGLDMVTAQQMFVIVHSGVEAGARR